MSGHFTDDMGIMGDPGGAGISGPTIGLGGGTWREIAGKKGMKASRRIIGDLAKADASGAAAAILDLNGTDDQAFALMAAPAATGDRFVFCGDRRFRFHPPRLSRRAGDALGRACSGAVWRREAMPTVGAQSQLG